MQIMHKTYSGTATVCTGCAAVTPGTVVYEMRGEKKDNKVRIGHPAGIITCDTAVENGRIVQAVFGRTARRIMEGRCVDVYKRQGGSAGPRDLRKICRPGSAGNEGQGARIISWDF